MKKHWEEFPFGAVKVSPEEFRSDSLDILNYLNSEIFLNEIETEEYLKKYNKLRLQTNHRQIHKYYVLSRRILEKAKVRMQLKVELPIDFKWYFNDFNPELSISESAKQTLLIGLLTTKTITLKQAIELSGMNIDDYRVFLKSKNIEIFE